MPQFRCWIVMRREGLFYLEVRGIRQAVVLDTWTLQSENALAGYWDAIVYNLNGDLIARRND